jgi:hypothetical protein
MLVAYLSFCWMQVQLIMALVWTAAALFQI